MLRLPSSPLRSNSEISSSKVNSFPSQLERKEASYAWRASSGQSPLSRAVRMATRTILTKYDIPTGLSTPAESLRPRETMPSRSRKIPKTDSIWSSYETTSSSRSTSPIKTENNTPPKNLRGELRILVEEAAWDVESDTDVFGRIEPLKTFSSKMVKFCLASVFSPESTETTGTRYGVSSALTLNSLLTSHLLQAHSHLISSSSTNAATLATIRTSAFVLSLDNATPSPALEPLAHSATNKSSEGIKEFSERLWKAGGASMGPGEAANRWWDKPLQWVVFANGESGFIGEHSCMDGECIVPAIASSTDRGTTRRYADRAIERLFDEAIDYGFSHSRRRLSLVLRHSLHRFHSFRTRLQVPQAY